MSIATTPTEAGVSEASSERPPFPVYRFTVEQYHRMIDAGILDEDDQRTELLEGWIVPKMTKNPPHDTVITLIAHVLGNHLPQGWHIRTQAASTTADSEPEPDLTIVKGEIRRYLDHHPTPSEITVAIEVADSSKFRDRYKRRLYARAGIPVYWIVNLGAARIEVYTDPTGPADDPHYRRRDDVTADAEVPLTIDGRLVAHVPARELLP